MSELERITARRSELDALAEELGKRLQEVQAEREELVIAERVLLRLAEQDRAEAEAAVVEAPVKVQVAGRAVLLVPHRGDSPDEMALPGDYRRILAIVRAADGPVPDAFGVGSSHSTSSARFGPWPPLFLFDGCCEPPFLPMLLVGVLSRVLGGPGGEEGPLATMGGSDVGGTKHEPPCVVPEIVQGAEYGTKCPHARRGDFVDARDGAISLREYVEKHWWPSQAHPAQTLESMRYRIWGQVLPQLGDLALRDIGVAELRKWSADVQRAVASSTAYVAWVYLKAIMQAAVEDKRLYRNPCKGNSSIKPPKKPERKARAWEQDRVDAVREALADRYRIALDLGVGCGLRQGETFGFSPGDVHGDFVHIERQILRYKSRLYFGPPKGGKERDVPLPKVLAKRLLTHQERFEPIDVTLPWLDPEEPDLAREDRRKVTVPLLVYTGRRGAITRTTWNTKAWKPALADVGVIPPLPERQPGEKPSRVWEPSREHGFHVLRHTYASVMLEAGESIVSLAKWLGHSDPAFTLRTYTHFMPQAGARGLSAIEAWFTDLG